MKKHNGLFVFLAIVIPFLIFILQPIYKSNTWGLLYFLACILTPLSIMLYYDKRIDAVIENDNVFLFSTANYFIGLIIGLLIGFWKFIF